MEKPIIHVYAVCKNEVEFIPFFLNHYENIADKIVVFDNQSTDGTRRFLNEHPKCELINYDSKGELRDDIHMWIKNSAWKESKGLAEWVIVSDLDELLYHQNLIGYLTTCKKQGYTICETEGYDMVSDEYPVIGHPIVDQVRFGSASKQFSKTILFDPNEITEVYFSPGGHHVRPEGNVKLKESDGLKLLHYKYLGGLDRLQKRWDATGAELSDINKQKGWGVKRAVPDEIVRRYNAVKKNAIDVLAV